MDTAGFREAFGIPAELHPQEPALELEVLMFFSDPSARMLRQRDNFRFGQREYFRFFGLRYSFDKKEYRPHERGTDHVDQKGT